MNIGQTLARINAKLAEEGQGHHVVRRGSVYIMLDADDTTVYTADDLDILAHFILGALLDQS